MSVLAIDLETKNFSYEIGGWDNTHMFLVSTVCTWDGDKGTIYIDKAVDDLVKSIVQIKPLSWIMSHTLIPVQYFLRSMVRDTLFLTWFNIHWEVIR